MQYLKRLQDRKLLLFAVKLEGHSKNSMNAVEPQAVAGARKPNALEPEGCNDETQNTTRVFVRVSGRLHILRCFWIKSAQPCSWPSSYLGEFSSSQPGSIVKGPFS